MKTSILKTYLQACRRVANKTLYLENLKATPFVALYTDETGNTRVSGSPDYPLTFSFEIGGGLYNCTLSGTGPGVDAFL